jgi:multicomponent Na+:H+ antiporter subunit G
MLIGLGLQSGFTFVTVKIVIIGIFLFITGPTSTHALANAAFSSGVRPEQKLDSD